MAALRLREDDAALAVNEGEETGCLALECGHDGRLGVIECV